MTDDHERAYMAGKRTALLKVARDALHDIGETKSTDARIAKLLSEREEAMVHIRALYEHCGWECDWDEHAHFADVMKHVAKDVVSALEDS